MSTAAWPSSMPGRRRRRWPWLLGLLTLLVVWGVLVVLQLVAARAHAVAGIERLERAEEALTPARLLHADGVDDLRAAHDEFARAAEQVSSPLVAPLRVLPVIGRQVRSVTALTHSATDVVDAGLDAMDRAQAELDRADGDRSEQIAVLERLAAISADTHARLAEVDLGPADALVAPLRDARARFADELDRLRNATRRSADASRGIAEFLRGPTSYLVLAANNNEMRIGSGTFLSVGTVSVRDGAFELGEMASTDQYRLPEGAVTLTGDVADRWGWLEPEQEWRNLASSPLFPAQAALAAQMWETTGKPPVDGVLVLDPVALQALLEATGGVQVDGRRYDAGNVLREIYLEQYQDMADAGFRNAVRRERLSEIAGAVVRNLDGDVDILALAEQLHAAAEGRHVLAWSRTDVQQAGWVAAGVAGTLQPESLLLGVHNRGGNKLDQFLQVEADLTTAPADDGGTVVTVDVRMRNTAPRGLPEYVAGPVPTAVGGREGLYQGLLVAQLPALARDMTITGADGEELPVAAAGPDGDMWVVAGYVEADRGETAEATVRFQLPPGSDELRVEPSARVPAVAWQYRGQRWHDERARAVRW